MAHFHGKIRGRSGEAIRLGSKKSGMRTWVHGWHGGVEVVAFFNEETQSDEFHVFETKGISSDTKRLIAEVTTKGGEHV